MTWNVRWSLDSLPPSSQSMGRNKLSTCWRHLLNFSDSLSRVTCLINYQQIPLCGNIFDLFVTSHMFINYQQIPFCGNIFQLQITCFIISFNIALFVAISFLTIREEGPSNTCAFSEFAISLYKSHALSALLKFLYGEMVPLHYPQKFI